MTVSEASKAPVDLERLADWMDGQALPSGPIGSVEALGGGTQNILLRFERGGRRYVLRHPPPHKRENSDETMRREARVLAAIAGSDVPHPPIIAACPDESVLGAAFYLMEPVEGFNPSTGLPSLHAGDGEIQRGMGLSMVDGIAALGAVDHLAVGLDGFGRPEGYLERQVGRWQRQLESYAKFDAYPGPDIPGLDRVARWLEDNRPASFQPGILHGDYHLANVMFRYDGPQLAAIVDWELCTIGDPLLDLGWMIATWPANVGSGGVSPLGNAAGFTNLPGTDELVRRYGERTTRSLDAIEWYAVLACYKLGIILEGTHARAYAGKAPKSTGDLLHATTVGLFEQAEARIARA